MTYRAVWYNFFRSILAVDPRSDILVKVYSIHSFMTRVVIFFIGLLERNYRTFNTRGYINLLVGQLTKNIIWTELTNTRYVIVRLTFFFFFNYDASSDNIDFYHCFLLRINSIGILWSILFILFATCHF